MVVVVGLVVATMEEWQIGWEEEAPEARECHHKSVEDLGGWEDRRIHSHNHMEMVVPVDTAIIPQGRLVGHNNNNNTALHLNMLAVVEGQVKDQEEEGMGPQAEEAAIIIIMAGQITMDKGNNNRGREEGRGRNGGTRAGAGQTTG